MSISKTDVEYVAKLARLRLDAEETEKMTTEIAAILEYVNLLDDIELTDVAPSYHPLNIKQPLRADEPKTSIKREEALSLAPEEDGSFFIVPKVV